MYSTSLNEANPDEIDGHSGYLPAIIYRFIKTYYDSTENEIEGWLFDSTDESRMRLVRNVDSCVGEKNDRKKESKDNDDCGSEV